MINYRRVGNGLNPANGHPLLTSTSPSSTSPPAILTVSPRLEEPRSVGGPPAPACLGLSRPDPGGRSSLPAMIGSWARVALSRWHARAAEPGAAGHCPAERGGVSEDRLAE